VRGARGKLKNKSEDSPLNMKIHTHALTGAALLALLAPVGANGATPKHKEQTVASLEQPADKNEVTAALPSPDRQLQPGDSVVAIVNDSIVTDYDLRQRVKLFSATSGGRMPTAEEMKDIREQVLKQLETERLELVEAQKNKIAVSSAEVDKAVDNIMSDNHLTIDQLTGMLSKSGVQMSTLRAQIAAQIAWSKTVEDQYGDQVKVSPQNVDAEMARNAAGADKPHFRVSEIFLPVDTPEQDPKVKTDAENLETQLKQGAQFAAVARQFSQTPTAAQGGDMGIIVQGQLPSKELNDALAKLSPGEVSEPVRAPGGYYILYLQGREEGLGTKVPDPSTQRAANPDGSVPLDRLLFPVGNKPAPALLKNVMQIAEQIRQNVVGCDRLSFIAAQLKGSQLMSLGNMKPAEMSVEMRAAVTGAGPGQAAAPFLSAAGVELIVRCDKPIPKTFVFQMPTRDQVEQQLYADQVAVLARRYLRDLKRDADIETR
jgi:peptidyl-prolyl cis-trans isomerase SurA